MTTSGPGVELAVRLVRQAVHQDSRQNYPEAARCYREAILILQDLKTSRSSTCKELQIFLDTKLLPPAFVKNGCRVFHLKVQIKEK